MCVCVVQVREGKRTQIVAVGAEAVTNAVLAVGNARLFLEQNGMDIKVCANTHRHAHTHTHTHTHFKHI